MPSLDRRKFKTVPCPVLSDRCTFGTTCYKSHKDEVVVPGLDNSTFVISPKISSKLLHKLPSGAIRWIFPTSTVRWIPGCPEISKEMSQRFPALDELVDSPSESSEEAAPPALPLLQPSTFPPSAVSNSTSSARYELPALHNISAHKPKHASFHFLNDLSLSRFPPHIASSCTCPNCHRGFNLDQLKPFVISCGHTMCSECACSCSSCPIDHETVSDTRFINRNIIDAMQDLLIAGDMLRSYQASLAPEGEAAPVQQQQFPSSWPESVHSLEQAEEIELSTGELLLPRDIDADNDKHIIGLEPPGVAF